MNISDINYMAGFFDGEGCITTSGITGFRVCVSSTDRSILEWIRVTFGGSINDQYLPSNPKWAPAWKWVVCNKPKVKEFLQIIYPYSKLKTKQIKIVIDYLSQYPDNKHGRIVPLQEKTDFLIAKEELRKRHQRQL